MPVIATIRDAVVDAINAASLSPAVTAAAAYEASVNLETFAAGQSRLLVIPRGFTPDLLTFEGDEERKPSIDVVLQYHAAKTAAADLVAELDPYLALAESISELMLGFKIDPGTMCTEVRWEEGAWNTEHVEKYKLLTIVLSCTFDTVA